MQRAFMQAELKSKQNAARSTLVEPSVSSSERAVQLNVRRTVVMLLSVVAMLFGSGCTVLPRLAVSVDAIDSGQAVQDVRYVLKPVVKDVDESDLHFIEYSRHIESALQKHGMTKADSADQANVEIAVNYGFKRHQRALLRHSVFDDPFYFERRCRQRQNGRCVRWYRSRFYDRHDWFHERYRRQVDVITNYRVFVSLEARLKDADAAQPALWTTRARARFRKPDHVMGCR